MEKSDKTQGDLSDFCFYSRGNMSIDGVFWNITRENGSEVYFQGRYVERGRDFLIYREIKKNYIQN